MLLQGDEPTLHLVAAAIEPPPAQTLAEKGFETGEIRRDGRGGDVGLFAGHDAEAAFEQRGFELFEFFDGETGAFDHIAKGVRQEHHGMRQMDHAESAPVATEIGDLDEERASFGELGAERPQGFDGVDAMFEHVKRGGVRIGGGGAGQILEGIGDDTASEFAADAVAKRGGLHSGGIDLRQRGESAQEGSIAGAEFEDARARREQFAIGFDAAQGRVGGDVLVGDEPGAGGEVGFVGVLVEVRVGGRGGAGIEIEQPAAQAEIGGQAEAMPVVGEESTAFAGPAGVAASGFESRLPAGGHAACSL